MVIYQVRVSKGGAEIFTHDVVMVQERPFSDDVHAALETFRQSFPAVDLMDEKVRLLIARKPD